MRRSNGWRGEREKRGLWSFFWRGKEKKERGIGSSTTVEEKQNNEKGKRCHCDTAEEKKKKQKK